MTAVSQSGYPVITDRADPRILKNPTVPGTEVQILGGVLAGPVATVLLYYAARFDREVEHLELGPEPGDDWGGNAREIRDGTGWSNHASYTAIDLNATEHPQHERGTFTARQYAAMRRIAQELAAAVGRPVLRLGIDWADASVDEMHAEIAPDLYGTGVVERAARLIQRGAVPAVPPQLLEGADMPLTDADVEKVATATVEKLMAHDMGEIRDAANSTAENPTGATKYNFFALCRRLIRLTGLTQDDVRKDNQAEAAAAGQ